MGLGLGFQDASCGGLVRSFPFWLFFWVPSFSGEWRIACGLRHVWGLGSPGSRFRGGPEFRVQGTLNPKH